MKNSLAITSVALIVLLFVFSISLQTAPEVFPSDNSVLETLRMHSPDKFWRTTKSFCNAKVLTLPIIRETLQSFIRLKVLTNPDDKISAAAVQGFILFKYNFFEAAASELEYVVKNSQFDEERNNSLVILARIYHRLKNKAGYIEAHQKMLKFEIIGQKEFDKAIEMYDFSLTYKPEVLLTWILIWISLLLFPALILEFEQRAWIKKYSHLSDKKGAFQAFRTSVLPEFLIVLSGISFLVFDLPSRLGINFRFILMIAHFFIVWLLVQFPIFKLEKFVLKSRESFGAFVFDRIRLIIFNHMSVFVFVVTLLILHLMTVWLPLWQVNRPFGLIFSFPAVFMTILGLTSVILPRLLLLKKVQTEEPYEKGITAVFSASNKNAGFLGGIPLGAFSFNSAVLLWGDIEDRLSKGELRSYLRSFAQLFKLNYNFCDFLLIFIFTLSGSFYTAIRPMNTINLLILGPTFAQLLGIILFMMLAGWSRRNFYRHMVYESDRALVVPGHSEEFIDVLERINEWNYLPPKFREADTLVLDQPSLIDRKINLRSHEGEYFENPNPPENDLLLSMWRAKLGTDWKLGEEEAIRLCSIDDNFADLSIEECFVALAKRHRKLGAEVIYDKENSLLKILWCRQKAACKNADPQLPDERVCFLCSQGTIQAIFPTELKWESSKKGCKFFIKDKGSKDA